jgi:hypothetical protein
LQDRPSSPVLDPQNFKGGGRADSAEKETAMRILIAEGDQVLADGLLRTLRASGAAVDHVASGREADARHDQQQSSTC